MKDLTIPNGVEILRNSCFAGGSYTSVFIPKSVATVEEKIFLGTGWDYIVGRSNLKIYCEAESKPSGWSSLWNQVTTSYTPSTGEESPIMHTNIYWGYSRERYLEEIKNT